MGSYWERRASDRYPPGGMNRLLAILICGFILMALLRVFVLYG
jgi:hypothetical protein